MEFEEDTGRGTRGNGRDRGSDPHDDIEGGPWPDKLREMTDRAKVWVTGNPFAALGVAAAVGFVFGRIFRRVG